MKPGRKSLAAMLFLLVISAAMARPSAIMPAASCVVAFTSPLMGPSTMAAMAFNVSA